MLSKSKQTNSITDNKDKKWIGKRKYEDPHEGRTKQVHTPHGHFLLGKAREFLEKYVQDRFKSNTYGCAHMAPLCPTAVTMTGACAMPPEILDAMYCHNQWGVAPHVWVDVGAGGGLERLTKAVEAGSLGCAVRAVSLNPTFQADDIVRKKKQRALAKLDPRVHYSEDGLGTFNRAVRSELPALGGRDIRLIVPDGLFQPHPPMSPQAIEACAMHLRVEGNMGVLRGQCGYYGEPVENVPVIPWSVDGELTVAAWLPPQTLAQVARAYYGGALGPSLRIALLAFLGAPVKYTYSFTHSYYYIEEWEKTYFKPDDVLFSQTHIFKGSSGCFPMKGDSFMQPEFTWCRMLDGSIRMTPNMPGGTHYYHRDTTPIYEAMFETVARGNATPEQHCPDAAWACGPQQARSDTAWTLTMDPLEINGAFPTDYTHLQRNAYRPYAPLADHRLPLVNQGRYPRSYLAIVASGEYPELNQSRHQRSENATMSSNDLDAHTPKPITLYWASAKYADVDLIVDDEAGESLVKKQDVLMSVYEGHVVPDAMRVAPPPATVDEFMILEQEIAAEAVVTEKTNLETFADCMVLKTDLLMGMEACVDSMQLHASSLIARYSVTMEEALTALQDAHTRRARIIDRMTGESAKAVARLRTLRKNYRYNTGESATLRFSSAMRNADLGFGTRGLTPIASLLDAVGRYRSNGDARA